MKVKEYIIAFLSGCLLISLSVMVYLLRSVKPVINTQSYVESLDQQIGKIKQRGEGNEQEVIQDIKLPETQEKRVKKPFLGIRLRKNKLKN